MFKKMTTGVALATLLSLPAFAGDMMVSVEDAYARSASPTAKTGAAFMVISNGAAEDDRLIAASTEIADRVELHTHKMEGDGVMRMIEVEEGFVIPAGGSHTLERGADHVMLMGLTESLVDGETVTLTLTFEQAGDLTLEVPVDLTRQPEKMMEGHGGHDHGHGDHSGHGGHSKTN